MELPSWALVPMWLATAVGLFFLSVEMIRRFL